MLFKASVRNFQAIIIKDVASKGKTVNIGNIKCRKLIHKVKGKTKVC